MPEIISVGIPMQDADASLLSPSAWDPPVDTKQSAEVPLTSEFMEKFRFLSSNDIFSIENVRVIKLYIFFEYAQTHTHTHTHTHIYIYIFFFPRGYQKITSRYS